jgi:hypothetical protein
VCERAPLVIISSGARPASVAYAIFGGQVGAPAAGVSVGVRQMLGQPQAEVDAVVGVARGACVVSYDGRRYKTDRMTPGDGSAVQQRIFRTMTPEQRLRAAFRLYWSARQLKEASLRALRPELSEAEIKARVRECFLYARD